MVLITLLLSTLGVPTIFKSVALSAPLSLSVLYPERATAIITETVQHTASSVSAFETIDWKIFVLPPEETSTTTEFVTTTVSVLPISTSTFTSTTEIVVTETITPSSALPRTTTVEIVTVTITPSPSKPTTWAAPAQMTDLSAFNITNFAGGSRNLCIVDDLSANTSTGFSGSSNSSMSTESVTFQVSNDYNSSNDPLIVWTNATSALQILYPEHSIDPAQKPQGGAEFYAVPLDLTDARSVTLEYSVFFPQDFDWVLGGKLPGLYGGRQGCSGGDAALDCFSTRLMWRKYGQGELYLYAPKDKQTDSLCNNPQSVCDAAYGLSVGRGSFVFAPGNWTKVRQTVILNTPGQQDGCFTLDVNGNRVINRNDVYYRGNPLSPSGSLSSAKSDNGSKKMVSKTTSAHPSVTSTSSPTSKTSPAGAHQTQPSDAGSLLGPGGLLDGILKRAWLGKVVLNSKDADPKQQSFGVISLDTPEDTDDDWSSGDGLEDPNPLSFGDTFQGHSANSSSSSQPPGFTGLFFSTFFGGHEKQYASPKDQLVWFKDFAMSNNG